MGIKEPIQTRMMYPILFALLASFAAAQCIIDPGIPTTGISGFSPDPQRVGQSFIATCNGPLHNITMNFNASRADFVNPASGNINILFYNGDLNGVDYTSRTPLGSDTVFFNHLTEPDNTTKVFDFTSDGITLSTSSAYTFLLTVDAPLVLGTARAASSGDPYPPGIRMLCSTTCSANGLD